MILYPYCNIRLQNMNSTIVPKPLPTAEMYGELQEAYDHFNRVLFDGELPTCMITLQRHKTTQGYYSPGRFTDTKTGRLVGEMALNPSFFALQGIRATMQTIVHEQVHCWQETYGTPGRGRYHNEEWAAKMESIGLYPSDTGRPGGKRTGDAMADYVIEGGAFDQAFKSLMTRNFALSWLDRFPISVEQLAATLHQLPEEVQLAITEQEAKELSIQVIKEEPKKQSTSGYYCPMCLMRVWGKKGLALKCIKCEQQLIHGKATKKNDATNQSN